MFAFKEFMEFMLWFALLEDWWDFVPKFSAVLAGHSSNVLTNFSSVVMSS